MKGENNIKGKERRRGEEDRREERRGEEDRREERRLLVPLYIINTESLISLTTLISLTRS